MSVLQTEVLVFVGGKEMARHVLGSGTHAFGSSAECSIPVAAALVSPRHFQLTVGEDGSVVLEDLGSADGTYLDGQRIDAPQSIRPNQVIQFGAAQILLLQRATDDFEEMTIAANSPGASPEFSPTVRYEIGSEIAKGGMGAVLTARQPAIRREVALKVMLRNVSAHDRLRFIEEAQITGQLEHPNIVPVHDLALNEHGQPYYTMKLVKGSTLKEILKLLAQGDTAALAKYPLAALLTIFQKVCDAVAFAHARGVLHRDLKPANIMVGDYGEVLVMDWGLAKIIGRNGSPNLPESPAIGTTRDDQHEVFATLDGAVMGTPQYMSPEQARGEVATLDQRSDIFSLGAILYELVTLLQPFPGKTTREILSNVKSGHFILPNARLRAIDAPHPRHLPAGVIPDSLEAVISKALAIDQNRRYQRVADFQADLTAYQGGFATGAENAGAWKQFTLLIKRHRALSIAVAASFLLIAGITAAFTTKVVAERDRAQAGEHAAQQANAENRRHLHEASMADYAVAGRRIEKDNRWSEGVTQLARALDLEPKNPLPAVRLYGTIALGAPDKTNLLRCMLPHGDVVISANFSPDGTRIVTGSDDKTARVWDVATGQPLGEPMRHEGAVTTASFSPDGTRIVTGSDDKTARLWDAATSQSLGEPMRHEGAVRTANFSPNGTRIVTASWDNTARLWDAVTGRPLGEPMRHEYSVESANFSPDGTRIVTASHDKTARLWDAATGKPLGEPMHHEGVVRKASFSPDGAHIVTASDDNTARLWDATTGKPVGEPMHHEQSVESASFSPDGTRVVTAGDDNTARLWDATTGKPVGEPMHHENTVASANFSPDGTRIVTASDDNTARLWDAATGKPLGEPMRHEDSIGSASFSPDGTRVVTASDDNTARLWDTATGKSLGEPMRHENSVASANFNPGSTRIVTASNDNTARLWDAATGQPLGEPMRHEDSVESASFSPDGTRIVTASDDKTARLWDAATGQPLGKPMRHDNAVKWASFSPNGARIVTASDDKTARLWDAATGQPLGKPMRHDNAVKWASFSPNGARVVTASDDRTARLWDATTGLPLGEPMRHEGVVESASFSPDGAHIVTASDDKTVRLWDAVTGQPFGVPMRHGSSVKSASFSPDGTRVVTASWDNTARLWDAATGQPLGEPMHHENSVESASFSPDGTRVVTASDDKTVRLWDAATGQPLGEPIHHEDSVFHASFSTDGTHIVTACRDNTARLWEIKSFFPLLVSTPEWVHEWARSLAGLRFDSNGVIHPMPAGERLRILYAPRAGDDPWSRLARWVATDPAKRTVDLDSPHTCREIAERERDFGSKESLESALRYDPTVPLARLMSAQFEENPQRAAFLRNYDLKRLPNDSALWVKAARSLHNQKDAEPATLEAWQKLEKLAPEKAVALRNEQAQQKRKEEAAALQRKRDEEIHALVTDIRDALERKDWDAAAAKLAVADKLVPEDKRAPLHLDFARFEILISAKDYTAADQLAGKISDTSPNDTWQQSELAWKIATRDGIDQHGLELADKIANRANITAKGKDPYVLDSLARVLFMEGKKEAAIHAQEQAVIVVEDLLKPYFEKTLDSYRQDILPNAD